MVQEMVAQARRWSLFALVAAASCASGSNARNSAEPFANSRPTTVRIIVQNRNFQDARLYTYRRGTRSMLGVVGGKEDSDFVIDWDLPEPMYMSIDLIGGGQCRTEEMMVDPGDILELQIAAVLTSTSGCR